MVRDLEAAGCQQGLNFAVDQLLQLRTGIEIGHDPAPGAHEVMVVMLRELFGQFVAVAAATTGNPHHNPGLNQLGKVAVGGRGGDPRIQYDLVDGQRA